ncbi:hypothetical protein JXD20_03890 [Candidatus Peregrinibacteria bacterium]|nr:hypothetical protein [Candidatus Peregrinibacteria bacterium]
MNPATEKPSISNILNSLVGMKAAIVSLLEENNLACGKLENQTEAKQTTLLARRTEIIRLLRLLEGQTEIPAEVHDGFKKLIYPQRKPENY